LKALEIPTDPRNGASLEALELALEQWPIRACALMPACHNPLGASMPAERKRQLVALLARYQVPLIEDDLFGDLEFASSRPPAARAFDEQGLVLYCSSVSKSLGTGLRVGWTIPGRFFSQVRHLSTFRNANGASLEQMAVADFMASGNYERHLRGLRRNFLRQLQLVSDCVHESFPPGTRLSRPQGGFVLWVELPGVADAWQLYHQALHHGIAIMPGSVFSPTGKYRNCFRLSAALPWREETATALATLGRLAHDLSIVTPP
jgi:DNA-binding transcriptional MocR family regulator